MSRPTGSRAPFAFSDVLKRREVGIAHTILFEMMSHYHVDAVWDPEAGVWVATSDDVPGLATEAATLEELTEKLHRIIPDLLTANGVLPGDDSSTISFELTGHRRELVSTAS